MGQMEYIRQIDELLAMGNQNWLFGAGISFDAGIPLMHPLTERVMTILDSLDSQTQACDVLQTLKDELPENAHIEHILSHLTDYIALAERSRHGQQVRIGEQIFQVQVLKEVYDEILREIANTVRWGYRPGSKDVCKQVGTVENPIVDTKSHQRFVRALFNRGQAGLSERRQAVKFFTTNYDTLLEDALALECIPFWDGFVGGAVAYRKYRFGGEVPSDGYRAHLTKLHGSIDWYSDENGQIWRVRDGDLYPRRNARVIIYPQAEKYVATQRDPFAAQFELFRRSLSSITENVLVICGYSFSDDHINQEIQIAMGATGNKTTIIACAPKLNPILDGWREEAWSNRLYMLSGKGLYVGKQGPLCLRDNGGSHDWWKFSGLTEVLLNGVEAYVAQNV